MNNKNDNTYGIDIDVVQVRINAAVAPLLKRIEVLEQDNKDLREIVEKFVTPKSANQSRVNTAKPGTIC